MPKKLEKDDLRNTLKRKNAENFKLPIKVQITQNDSYHISECKEPSSLQPYLADNHIAKENGNLSKEDEYNLLADVEIMSLFSEAINEDELLKEDNEEKVIEEKPDSVMNDDSEVKIDFCKDDNDEVVQKGRVMINNIPGCDHDDMFETVSLAATCDFNEEVEPRLKKKLPNR